MPNYNTHPSLENLIESENIRIESLHSGGLETTKELAELCKVTEKFRLLEIAPGTGEGTRFLVEEFKCYAVGDRYISGYDNQSKRKIVREKSQYRFQNWRCSPATI